MIKVGLGSCACVNFSFILSPLFISAKNKCVVFDVIFHPETYQLGQKVIVRWYNTCVHLSHTHTPFPPTHTCASPPPRTPA